MGDKTLRKLDEIVPKELLGGEVVKLEPYYDKPVIVHYARPVVGNFGEYWRVVISETLDGGQVCVNVGASQPSEVLRYLHEQKAFPVVVRFRKVGRATIVEPA